MSENLCRAALLAAVIVGLPVCALASEGASSNELSAAPSDWSFDVVPYLWIAGYDGTFSVPGNPPVLPSPPTVTSDKFTTHISAAAMVAGQVRYRDVGFYMDSAWLQLTTEGDSPSGLYSGSEIKSDIAYGAAEGTYRLPKFGKLEADLMAGARVWYASTRIELKPGIAPAFSSEASRTWCDPIIGANLRYDIADRWFAIVIGDVGGFGVGSQLSWNVFGGVGYRFNDWCSMTLGYRYLHVNYSNNGFLLNANVQGLLLGVGFHF